MEVTASSRESVFVLSWAWGRYKDSSWDGSLGLPPARGNVTKIQGAKSGPYLLLSSGLRLGSSCLGVEVSAGMQEAGITGICRRNGRHPTR